MVEHSAIGSPFACSCTTLAQAIWASTMIVVVDVVGWAVDTGAVGGCLLCGGSAIGGGGGGNGGVVKVCVLGILNQMAQLSRYFINMFKVK